MSDKNTVYEVTCDETEVTKIVCPNVEQVGQLIGGDIDNANGEGIKVFHYTVKVMKMSNEKFNNLPEWEG